jgi:hypothetical protein
MDARSKDEENVIKPVYHLPHTDFVYTTITVFHGVVVTA